MAAPRRYQEGDDDPLDVGDIPVPPITRDPIGVPPGFTTPTTPSDVYRREIGGAPRPRAPSYYDGDELIPARWSPDRILDLQRQLVAANLISPGARLRLGVMDETTVDGFYRLLAAANRYGTSWLSVLGRFVGESQVSGAGKEGQLFTVNENGELVPSGPGNEQLPTRTTPREDLEPVFRAAIIDTLGQGWDDARINSMVQAYQQLEIQRQREAFAAEGTSRNVMGTPSPEAFALSYAREADPEQAQTESFLGGMEDFLGLVGQWGGG